MPSNHAGARAALSASLRPQHLAAASHQAIKRLAGPRVTAWLARRRWQLICLSQGWRRIAKPMDPRWLEVLDDPAFQASMAEVADLSALDTARLANLWQWCGLSEEGAMIEVGAFRGGTSLHLSNRWPHRRIIVCDTFDGFARLTLDAVIDAGVPRGAWRNPEAGAVKALLAARGRDVVVLEGAFPDSDKSAAVRDVSFAHVDVDIYDSCRRSLEYLAPRATPSALFVVNDYLRWKTAGIKYAAQDFLAAHPAWLMLPAFPGQGVLLHRGAYGRGGAGPS